MEQQRPLRLGDLVDDYCPRERRVTNHAIVAIVEDAIRQTRCTACEADHVYKGGKAPARRKPKDEQTVLYEQVLANATAGTVTPPAEPVAPAVVAAAAVPMRVQAPEPVVVVASPVETAPAPDEPPSDAAPVREEAWTLNRRLIRASLPRIEGQSPVPRVIPEFTMHQRNVRGSQQFRGGGGQQGYNGNGSGNGGGNGWFDRSGNGGNSNGHRSPGFRPESPSQGQGEGQPGAPNGPRPPGGGGRRRRRHKPSRPPQN